jgi:NAD(P)-dependent dehydrogenase (short-subunit alcohol dehydrogenase family)
MKLRGKVALITGAGSGIGRATAILFAREGAKVVVVDYNEATARETAELIKKNGGEAIFIKADVSNGEEVRKMIERAVQEYGRLDILYNNAGIEGQQAPTAECPEENFERVISVNLRGVFLGMKYGIQQMLKQGGGVIINTASVAGMVGFAGLPAYCASKGGVIQLTRTAALEYATMNIRINAICPGVIWTPMVERFTGKREEMIKQFSEIQPVKRMGRPEEVAALALFLASEDSSFITGAAITIDGGYTAQ